MTRDHTFIAILASPDCDRRFRTAVLAADAQQAREEAERMATKMDGIGVEMVYLEADEGTEEGEIEPGSHPAA